MIRKERGNYGARNEAGVPALCCKVVEQAVEDYKTLEAEGYIRGGRAIWPESCKKFCDYSSKQQVEDLIGFFRRGHAKRYLENINSNIDPEAMLHSLGITKQKTP
mgnify:FL=1